VHAAIEVLGDADDQAAVNSLYRWLSGDPHVRQGGPVTLTQNASDGYMGSLAVIDAIVADTLGLLNLAIAFLAWRDSRKASPPVRITVGGRSVILVDDDSLEAAKQKLQILADDSGQENDTAFQG
jgi:hypothetical protein